MPSDNLLDPLGPRTPFVVAFIVAALLFVAWIGYLVWERARGQRTQAVVFAALAPGQKERWIAAIRGIGTTYLPAESLEDVRQLHRALGKEMRSIVSERSGRDVSSWTTGEMLTHPELTGVAELMRTWEQPTFAASPEAEGSRSVNGALELISRW